MSEIVKNEWRWGVVPELHPEAVVILGGTDKSRPLHCLLPHVYVYSNVKVSDVRRWYCILSTEPPKMPEPELRLPEGWVSDFDREWSRGVWCISTHRKEGTKTVAQCLVWHPTRRDCVDEINRILEGR